MCVRVVDDDDIVICDIPHFYCTCQKMRIQFRVGKQLALK